MKKTYFLRRSNISILGIIGSVYLGLIICFSFIAFSRYDLICYLLLILMGITPILFFMYKYLSSVGLYICGSDIYYKKIKNKKIDMGDVVGIRVIQSYGPEITTRYAPMKNIGDLFYFVFMSSDVSKPMRKSEGELLYTIFLLNEITDEMYNVQNGDLSFNQEFKRQIICSAVYCEEAVDYLKKLNPNIKIIK